MKCNNNAKKQLFSLILHLAAGAADGLAGPDLDVAGLALGGRGRPADGALVLRLALGLGLGHLAIGLGAVRSAAGATAVELDAVAAAGDTVAIARAAGGAGERRERRGGAAVGARGAG